MNSTFVAIAIIIFNLKDSEKPNKENDNYIIEIIIRTSKNIKKIIFLKNIYLK